MRHHASNNITFQWELQLLLYACLGDWNVAVHVNLSKVVFWSILVYHDIKQQDNIITSHVRAGYSWWAFSLVENFLTFHHCQQNHDPTLYLPNIVRCDSTSSSHCPGSSITSSYRDSEEVLLDGAFKVWTLRLGFIGLTEKLNTIVWR